MSPDVNGPGSDSMFEATNVLVDGLEPLAVSGMELLNSYAIVLIVAFVVVLLATPLVRLVALHANVTDQPDNGRKSHKYPVAYLGGIAVFLGLIAAIELVARKSPPTAFDPQLGVAARVAKKAMAGGVLTRALPSADTLALSPPLIISKTEIDIVVSVLRDAVDEIQSGLVRDGAWKT